MQVTMSERITYIQHSGKPVMMIDFSGANAAEMLAAVDEVKRHMAQHRRGTVLALADYSGAEINKKVATRIKEALVIDRPYVKRAAWIGTDKLPKVYYENFKTFSRREFPTFKTREEALEWLVSE
jgi:hypothetical protein